MRLLFLSGLLALLASGCSEADAPLFRLVPAADSGLTFANHIAEDDTFNILAFEFVYNGGGVAAGDFNGDDLPDLYFTGSTVANGLFLNEGRLRFRDVTERSGTGLGDRWCSGVTTVDINGDGQLDLYVSATTLAPAHRRRNALLVNQGNDENGVPVFRDEAAAYGLDHDGHNTQAAFFDYDRDGDLDVYLLIDEMINRNLPNRYLPRITDGSSPLNDRLLRNDPGPDGHPVFTDVTEAAGILQGGYGLGVSICDLNEDGWPDVYVTNDYLSNDLLWVNNGDGTFTDRARTYFKHTAYSAMGNDVADLNGDGHDDLISLDMFPETNLRRKAMMPPNNYTAYLNNERYDYAYQFTRNNLQLRAGNKPDGEPLFSEVGMQAGVAATDWSWSVLAADYDQDGDRDLLITNGFPKDVTDRDFLDYNVQFGNLAPRKMLLEQIPSVKIANYAYENVGGAVPEFRKSTAAWGMDRPSFSNGAVFADLDGDGDLDYVVNNANDPCFLYENTAADRTPNRQVTLRLAGTPGNPRAVGSRVVLRPATGDPQAAYGHPVRGYLSSVPTDLHFGLGAAEGPLAATVTWPDGRQEEFTGLAPGGRIVLTYGTGTPYRADPPRAATPLLRAVAGALDGLPRHEDSLFIDFNVQPLLPHKLSEYGPGLAAGDVDGDGLTDFYRSGSHFHPGYLLRQQADEAGAISFTASPLSPTDNKAEELGSLFFDADGDGDLDLYLVSGGSELSLDRPEYHDRLFRNDGAGNFTLAEGAVPAIAASGSCVRAADYDRDGDLDLFVGGRLRVAHFPQPVDSYLLENDGGGNFSRVAVSALEGFGLVCDALWTDYDNDGWSDLLVAGQGMPLTFLHNEKGALRRVEVPGLAERRGWWNGLNSADFDGDGDLDYVAANFGRNHLYRQDGEDYVALYGADFDGNGGYDLLLADRALGVDGELDEYLHFQRSDTEKQLNVVKRKYLKHADFGRLRLREFLADFPVDDLTVVTANYLSSAWVENLGDGTFALHELPAAAQAAPLFGTQTIDANADGFPDLVAIGNDYGTETGMGRLDGLNGIVLLFEPATGDFRPLPAGESGLYVPGNGRSLALLPLGETGVPGLVTSENQGVTTLYRFTEDLRWRAVGPGVAKVEVSYPDGRRSPVEIPYGSGFLSQNGRGVWLAPGATVTGEWTFAGERVAPSR